MNVVYSFLFPQRFRKKGVSFLILFVRLFFGILFFFHGLDKLTNFNEMVDTFPSIMGFGSYMSLMLAIFSEFCCSLFLMSGLLIRVVTIPMIISMAVAFFDVHDAMMPEGELSFIYMVIFILLYFTGPGRYSVDYLIDMKIKRNLKESEVQ